MNLDYRLRLYAGVAATDQGKVIFIINRTRPRPTNIRLHDPTIEFLFFIVLFLFDNLIFILCLVLFLLVVAVGVLDALELLKDLIVLRRALLS